MKTAIAIRRRRSRLKRFSNEALARGSRGGLAELAAVTPLSPPRVQSQARRAGFLPQRGARRQSPQQFDRRNRRAFDRTDRQVLVSPSNETTPPRPRRRRRGSGGR